MMKRIVKLTIVFVLMLLALIPAATAEENFGAWLTYWTTDDSLEDADAFRDRLDTAVVFAALFDRFDAPKVIPDTEALLDAARSLFDGTDTAIYLSVVNDIELEDGTYDNKSKDLLWRLFGSEEAMSAHMEALVSLIDEYDLDGLELDYENLKDDAELWNAYTRFIEKMWAFCRRDGVRLRVVLSWDAPKYATLPEGPEYTVMCYNLYGYHSGPGPKADLEFLETTCELYRDVPGTVRMAFSTGGFDWADGEITSLTQLEAEQQLAEAGVASQRDEASGALTAAYDSEGIHHELWYADAETLSLWHKTCTENGFPAFDLFRLGGNNLDDWADQLT